MRNSIKPNNIKQFLGIVLPILILYSQLLKANLEVVSTSKVRFPKMSSYESSDRIENKTSVDVNNKSVYSTYGQTSNWNSSTGHDSGPVNGDGSKTYEKYSCSSGNTSIGTSVTYEKVSGMKEMVIVYFANGKIKKLSGVSTPAKTVTANSQYSYDINGIGSSFSISQHSIAESRTGEHIGKMGTTTYDLIFNDQEQALSLQYRTGDSYNQYIKFEPGKPQSNGPNYTNYNTLLQKMDKYRMFVHCCSQKPQLTDINKCQTSYNKFAADEKAKKAQQLAEEAKKAEALRKSLLLPSQRRAEEAAEKARLASPFAR